MKSKLKMGDAVFYVNHSPIHHPSCEECKGSGRRSYLDLEYGGWEFSDCFDCKGRGSSTVKWLDGWVEIVNLGKILEIHFTHKGEVRYLTENHKVPILEEDLFSSLARALSYCKKNKLQLINPEVKTDASN